MRTSASSTPEKRPENDSPASGALTAAAGDLHRRRRLPWKPVAVALGFAIVLALEVLFLRFGPSMSVSAYAVVLVFLGLLVLVVLISELLSWLLFAQSLIDVARRTKRFKDGSP